MASDNRRLEIDTETDDKHTMIIFVVLLCMLFVMVDELFDFVFDRSVIIN